jgi:hypothetical protein
MQELLTFLGSLTGAIIGASGTLYVHNLTSRRNDEAVRRRLRALLRLLFSSIDVVSLGDDPAIDSFLRSAESQLRELAFAPDTSYAISAEQTNVLYELAYYLRAAIEMMDKLESGQEAYLSPETFDYEPDYPPHEWPEEVLKKVMELKKKSASDKALSLKVVRIKAKSLVDTTWRYTVVALQLFGEVDYLDRRTFAPNRDRLRYVLINGLKGNMPGNPLVAPSS